MCYSLHVGWAIEGALGSPLKVDASYVSPHYSLAKRLTDVARRYQVQLVMSDSFVKHLGSHQLNAECRPLDVVVVSGIKQPITLYTYQPPEYPSFMDASSQRRFTSAWLDAFDSYVEGDWDACKVFFEKCRQLSRDGDGPTRVLTRIIQDKQLKESWNGCCRLVSWEGCSKDAEKGQYFEDTHSTLHIHEEEERKRMEPLTDDERDKVLAQLRSLGTRGSKGKIGREHKFTSTHALVTGTLEHATSGLTRFLGIDDETVLSIRKDGEAAIVDEVRRLVAGAAQAKRRLRRKR